MPCHSERTQYTKEPASHRGHEPAHKPVPKYKNFNGVRYELASQDIYDKSIAQAKAKSLSSNGYYKTRVIRIQGAWRVYAHRVGFKCPHKGCGFKSKRRDPMYSHIREKGHQHY